MPHRKKSIYLKLYGWFFATVLLFFSHNVFEHYSFDVLHINRTFRWELFGMEYSFFIKDFFYFYDAPNSDYQMDIQNYVYKLSIKIIVLIGFLAINRLLEVLNFFLKDLPGRSCENLIAISRCFVGLFLYELFDYIFWAAQTNWIWEAHLFFIALAITSLTVKDK